LNNFKLISGYCLKVHYGIAPTDSTGIPGAATTGAAGTAAGTTGVCDPAGNVVATATANAI
jgi:hypothetical protein